MTKVWNGRRRNMGKGMSKVAIVKIHQLMDDGEERSIKEIIDVLLSEPRDNGRSLKHIVPTKRELSQFVRLNNYARRQVRKSERLQNGMVFRYLETRYRKQ